MSIAVEFPHLYNLMIRGMTGDRAAVDQGLAFILLAATSATCLEGLMPSVNNADNNTILFRNKTNTGKTTRRDVAPSVLILVG